MTFNLVQSLSNLTL